MASISAKAKSLVIFSFMLLSFEGWAQSRLFESSTKDEKIKNKKFKRKKLPKALNQG